ncbi:hypothetical protein [Saccharothrix lopnurensis]|uniref:Uncharacterized protein n=1 Tax=Saccharothrix lopnurensis TaxID=1670621 RepID=A0ABW1NY94_9PSEU
MARALALAAVALAAGPGALADRGPSPRRPADPAPGRTTRDPGTGSPL